jgi:hypothetical protein
MSAIIDRLQSQITGLFDSISSDLALLKTQMRNDHLLMEQQAARIHELERALAQYERQEKNRLPTTREKKKT